MTVSKTPRLNLTRWSADSDPWDRADFDGDNAELEARVVIRSEGTLAARPASTAGSAGRYYYATDVDELYYDTSSAQDGWLAVTRKHTTGTISSMGAGFSNLSTQIRRKGGDMCSMSIDVQSSAVLGADPLVLTVANWTAFTPNLAWPFPLPIIDGNGYMTGTVLATVNFGEVRIAAAAGIAANTRFRGSTTYPLGS